MGRANFKQLRHFAGLLVLAAAAGCAQIPTHSAAVPKAAPAPQPLARMTVPTAPVDRDSVAQLLLGEFAVGSGDLKQAAEAYARAARVSDDPVVAERAVGLAIATGDDAAAKRAIERWKALGADAAGLAQARAELALGNGDTQQAREQLLELVRVGGPDAWRTVGRVLIRARDPAQAGIVLEAVAKPSRLPNDPAAWLAMSELADRLGRHDYALTLADAAIRKFHNGAAYAWAGQLKLKTGDREAARKLYAKGYALDPRDEHVRMGYAALLGQLNHNRRAEQVLAHGPQNHLTYAARAGFAARSHDKAALRRIYDQLRKAPPDVRDQSAYLLGQLADLLGHADEAIDWYAQVGDDDPHAFDADMRRAYLLDTHGHPFQAHALLEQVRSDYADDSDRVLKASRLDAELYLRDGDTRRAAAAFTQALQLKPHDPALLYGRGMAYAESGQVDAAIADWRTLLRLKPGDVDAANALGYTLADANRDLGEAEKLLRKARAARPDDPAIADSWGWLQYRLGHLHQAEKALRQAWQGRKDPEVGAHLAQVLWKLGRRKEARQVLATARRLGANNRAVHAAMEMMSS